MKIKHMLVVALLIIIAGTQTVQAADNLPPLAIANFDGAYNMGIGHVDETVTFDGSNSYDPDGTIVSYTWDFGDNTSGTGMMANHIYTMPGNYSVALTVTDDGVPALSDTGFTTAEIIIRNQPPVADAGGPYAGYAGEPITFDGSGSYDPDGTIVLYMWYFDGKGPYMGVTQTYTFTEPGIYTVSLYVSDDGGPFFDLYDVDAITVEILPQNQPPLAYAGGPYTGYAGEPIQFNGSGSSDSDGTIVSYQWSFGDNTTGVGIIPEHTYTTAGTYTVNLLVTDNEGAIGANNTTAEILILPQNQPPLAYADGPYTGYAGEPIQFNGSGSFDSDGTIVSYQWSFGDNSTGVGIMPEHTYTTAGTYIVNLLVTDNEGAIGADNTTAEILILPQNQPPLAYAGGLYTGYAGEPIQFNGSGSFDSDGTIVSYQWSFGDNSTGVGIIPEHTYTTAGTYTVNLLVTDNEGATGANNTTAEILILPQNQPPLADAGGLYTGYVGEPIQFDGSGSSDSDGTIVSYQWSFGDNATGVGIMPEHTYTTAGTYTVNLIVTDNEGATGANNTTAEIIVRPPPVDLDITELHVTKRISLNKIKPVTIRMAVMNNGMGNEPRIANVVGMQNGVEVYNVNMPVSSDVGVSTTWVFPAYTPTVIGTITWTATINDDYPDIDKAVSTTKVAK